MPKERFDKLQALAKDMAMHNHALMNALATISQGQFEQAAALQEAARRVALEAAGELSDAELAAVLCDCGKLDPFQEVRNIFQRRIAELDDKQVETAESCQRCLELSVGGVETICSLIGEGVSGEAACNGCAEHGLECIILCGSCFDSVFKDGGGGHRDVSCSECKVLGSIAEESNDDMDI